MLKFEGEGTSSFVGSGIEFEVSKALYGNKEKKNTQDFLTVGDED